MRELKGINFLSTVTYNSIAEAKLEARKQFHLRSATDNCQAWWIIIGNSGKDMERVCLQAAMYLRVDVPKRKHDVPVSNHQLSFEGAQTQNVLLCQHLARKNSKYYLNLSFHFAEEASDDSV